jgi:uncharacterized protein (TIGR02284 family)
MQDVSQSIITLTSLIEVNNKRVKVYRSVAERATRKELKALFTYYADQSRSFSGSLSTWRAAYGGFGLANESNGSFSLWAQLKDLLGIGVRNPVVLCEEVEQDALKAYRTAVDNSKLPTATVADVQKQTREVEKALARLKTLKITD